MAAEPKISNQSCSSVALIADDCSLAMVFASASAINRSTGSAISVASLVNIPETLLRAGRSVCSWTDAGTSATRDEVGNSPRSSRNWRTTPDANAITTSLTVTRKWFFTLLTSSRSSWAKATLRRVVKWRFSDVRGAENGAAIARPAFVRRMMSRTAPTVPGTTVESRRSGRSRKALRPVIAICSSVPASAG